MKEMKAYKFMCTLFGHTGDVKSLCPTRDYGGFVSVSRDLTAKLWQCETNSNQYAQTQTITTHKKYVNAVVVVYNLKDYPNGLIITGSNDQTIGIHDIETNQQLAQLKEHEGAVCSLYFDNNSNSNLLYSGSFDSTAKVWNLNNLVKSEFQLKPSITIKGHEQTVWSVVAIEKQHVVLTGSADKTIKHWQLNNTNTSSEYVCKYVGHTDCVRGIALSNTNNQEFFSCSNDGCVIQWQYSMPNPFRIFRVTDSFLYSINMMHSSENDNNNNECLFITSGEDRTLRIHSTSKSTSDSDSSGCIQSIALPSQTLWYTVCLPSNGNIAVACSDGSIRLFTQKDNLCATQLEQEEYETELSQFAIPLKTNEAMSQIDRKELPTSEALAQPGHKDGQTLMVKNEENNEIEVYQWSKADARWIKIGVAVGSASAAGGGVGSRQKASYLGKEYDYVFDIQLDDENQKLKLPYNLAEDPYFVAQKFIYKHELSQSYLDEIANFIIKNTQGETIGTAGPSPYFDPFTGENRYIPTAGTSSSNNKPPPIGLASADPFTGSSSYNAVPSSSNNQVTTPRKAAAPAAPNSNEYFPHLDFILFDQINFAPILKKLREFQQLIANEYKNELINDKNNIELLENLLSESATGSSNNNNQLNDQVELLFQMIDAWPIDYVFPLVDLVRILVLNKNIAMYLTRDNSSTKDFVNKQGQHGANYYFDILLKFINEDKMINTMLVLKIFCNLFSSLNDVRSAPIQKLLVYMLHERLYLIHRIKNFLNSDNKSFQIAFTTLLLNYTVLIEKLFDYTDKFSITYISDVSMELIEFINSEQLNESIFNYDLESIFRILVCSGTLLVKTNAKKDAEYLITVFKSLEYAKSMCERIVQKSDKYTEKVHKSANYLLKILN